MSLAMRCLMRGHAARATARLSGLAAPSAVRGLALTRSVVPASTTLARQVRGLATRQSWDEMEDVDLDSVAYGFMASQALFAGLELGIFDAISEAGPSTAMELRKACNCDAPRLQTLLTSLCAIKCVRRDADGKYHLSPNTAQYMVTSSRHFYGDYLKYQIGRQFYQRMGALPDVMQTGKAPSYASWFSDPEVAKTYTQAQHNGSVATAKYLVKKKLDLGGITSMLDVGGGSGAFSYVFVGATPGLNSTVLELPEVCRTGNEIRVQQPEDVQKRVKYVELDATSPTWPVKDGDYELVLMSYISGSVPEPIIVELYKNAYKALKPGGRLLVHDFMVNDSLDGPALGALWGLQHVTVNADGLGLCPKEIIDRMVTAGFDKSSAETMEMIHGMTKLIVGHKK
jgi:SAM-dependent methyltransferase